MASESTLKKLFEISKQSVLFKGMSDNDIWNACLAHTQNSDEEVLRAIKNIQKKDAETEQKALENQKNLEESKKMIQALHEKEASDRQMDSQNAEQILENLFQ